MKEQIILTGTDAITSGAVAGGCDAIFAYPTSQLGRKTPVQIDDVFPDPFNPISIAIAAGASFVAQGAVSEKDLTRDLIKQAVSHHGFSLVNIFQACPSFNKVNTHKWFRENVKPVSDTCDPTDKCATFATALQTEPWPLGILYREDHRTTFEDNIPLYQDDATPLYKRDRTPQRATALLSKHR